MAEWVHGTRSYSLGCRCSICKEAKRVYSQQRRGRLIAVAVCAACGRNPRETETLLCGVCAEINRVTTRRNYYQKQALKHIGTAFATRSSEPLLTRP